MNPILVSVTLVLFVSLIVWLINKIGSLKICPFCAGVSLAWLGLTAATILGIVSGQYLQPIALLMGGTVVGIVYQGEKRFNWSLRWKLLILVIGFIVAYFLLSSVGWPAFFVETIMLAILTYLFFLRSDASRGSGDSERVQELEKKMEECC